MQEPSFSNGFASPWYGGRIKYLGLWRGNVGSWSSLLGPTGATLFDQSGWCNHGTLTNMDPATDWVVRRYGYALNFDGSNDYVATSATFKPGTGRGSLQCWFNGYNTTQFGSLVTTRPSSFNSSTDKLMAICQGSFISGDASKKISLGIFDTVASYRSYLTDWDLIDNNWHHIYADWDGSSGRVFFDGQQMATTITSAGSAPNPDGRGTLSIGAGNDGVAPVSGDIAEASAHLRLLTPNEITLLARRPGIMYELDDDDVWGSVEAGGVTTAPWYYYAQQQVVA